MTIIAVPVRHIRNIFKISRCVRFYGGGKKTPPVKQAPPAPPHCCSPPPPCCPPPPPCCPPPPPCCQPSWCRCCRPCPVCCRCIPRCCPPIPPNPCCPVLPHGNHKIYKYAFFFGGVPLIIVQILRILREYQHHEKEPCRQFDFMRRRTKRFPWGDGNETFFHNEHVNSLPEECEVMPPNNACP